MRYDHNREFEARFYRWPAQRRGAPQTCRNIWGWMFAAIPEQEHADLLAWIDKGLAHWLATEDYRAGKCVHSFRTFLEERMWEAVPAAEHAPVMDDAPPLECGCGEAGCAICRVLVRCG